MKIKPFILMSLIFPILLNSCDPDFQQEKSSVTINVSLDSEGISRNLSSASKRTIIPDLDNRYFSFELTLSNGIRTIGPDRITQNSEAYLLENGTWTVSAEALNSENQVVASESRTIVLPGDAWLDIPLSLAQSGMGHLDLSVAYQLSPGMSLGDASGTLLPPLGGSPQALSLSNLDSPLNLTGSNIPSGDYLLNITFKDSNGTELIPYTDIVHIYDNIVTVADLTLDEAQFNQSAKPAVQFDASRAVNGIELHWTDSNIDETGYIIHRKETGQPFTVLAELNSSNISSYTDETAVSGIGYSYRIAVKNDFGVSSWTEPAHFIIDPDVVYVVNGANGAGTSWSDGITDLQSAIEIAAQSASDAQVWVKQGIYFPQSQPFVQDADNPQYNHYALKNGVSVFGGFKGNENSLDEREQGRYPSILSGDLNQDDRISGRGRTLNIRYYYDNIQHLFYHQDGLGLDHTAVLDGFTLTGGYADSFDKNNRGGGAIWNGAGNSMIIRNVLFMGNISSFGGGAVYDAGSGVYINCVFTHNRAQGGGAFIGIDSVKISQSIFYGNYSYNNGGGGAIDGQNIHVTNSLFVRNYSEYNGGAIHDRLSSVPGYYNNIFWDNYAVGSGNHLYQKSSDSNADVRWNLFQPSPVGISQESDSFTGTISDSVYSDPAFIDIGRPEGVDGIWGTADDGLRTALLSAVIDGGNQDYLPRDFGDIDRDGDFFEVLPLSIDGTPRVQNGILDLGPYESSY